MVWYGADPLYQAMTLTKFLWMTGESMCFVWRDCGEWRGGKLVNWEDDANLCDFGRCSLNLPFFSRPVRETR